MQVSTVRVAKSTAKRMCRPTPQNRNVHHMPEAESLLPHGEAIGLQHIGNTGACVYGRFYQPGVLNTDCFLVDRWIGIPTCRRNFVAECVCVCVCLCRSACNLVYECLYICICYVCNIYMYIHVCIWCDMMIQLLTAIGLTPGGSSTVHSYTQTVHRTTQWNRIPRKERK